jgi:hypothetical protein
VKIDNFEDFTYPPYDAPLAEAYGGHYEALYVLLHPFIRVPDALSWRATQQYPTDAQIQAYGAKCTWTEVAAESGLAHCARLNQALLTSIGSLTDERDDASARTLQQFLESSPLWMPTEGRFEPLLHADFLAAFAAAGHSELIHVPEFPTTDPIRHIPIASLQQQREKFPARASLVAPDASFLFTNDWDSFFTLFYGPRAFVTEVVRQRRLEGFFASASTEHFWFHYAFGCSIVTISPEIWQPA